MGLLIIYAYHIHMYLRESITYVNDKYVEAKEAYPTTCPQTLKSSLIYQHLFLKHFDTLISIHEILIEVGDDIGLIGTPSTQSLQYLLSGYELIRKHAIFHDAFGRFYANHDLDRGYCYALPYSTSYMKSSPLLGHISGIIHQAYYSHDI